MRQILDSDDAEQQYSTDMAAAALDATHDHVEAAKNLCMAVTTTGLVGISSDEDYWKLAMPLASCVD